MNRRGFITGLVALGVTAPAIVRAGSLMPIKALGEECLDITEYWDRQILRVRLPQVTWRLLNQGVPLVKNEYLNDLVYHA